MQTIKALSKLTPAIAHHALRQDNDTQYELRLSSGAADC